MEFPFIYDPSNPLSFFTSLGISLSSLSALLLSAYNWYVMRKGAVIKVTDSYQFGFIRYQSGRKLLYFPLDVMNSGTKLGKIDEVTYFFTLENGKTLTLTPTRRVAIKQSITDGKNLTQTDFVNQLPTLPIFCPSNEGISELFEYYEDADADGILKEDVLYNGVVTVRYNGNRLTSKEFSLKFPERSSNNIIWVNFEK